MAQGFWAKATALRSDVSLTIFIALMVTGLILTMSYVMPEIAGGALGGTTILVTGIAFVGTFLVWISLWPAELDDSETGEPDTEDALLDPEA